MRNVVILVLMVLTASSFAQSKRPTAGQKLAFSANYKPAAFQHEAERLKNLKPFLPQVEKMYKDFAQKNKLPSVVYAIVADGKMIYSAATGVTNLKTQKQATTTSLFRIASMTKSFTAMAIMKLKEEGKLSITDPASKYVSEMNEWVYPTNDAHPFTVHNLLTMTAGFPEDNPWRDRQLDDTDEEFIDFLKNGVSFSSTPGDGFEYSNLGYAILGLIVTRASGMPYQDYIKKAILQPLDMNNTFWEFSKANADELVHGYRWEDEQWKEEPMLHDGAYGAMGGLITSIEDFSKYVAFHLTAYPSRSEGQAGPVKRSSVREMHKPYTTDLYTDSRKADGTLCPVVMGYGLD